MNTPKVSLGVFPLIKPETLSQLIGTYRRTYVPPSDQYAWMHSARSLRDAVVLAARSIDPDDRVLPHQRRVGRKRLERLADALSRQISAFASARDFDELYRLIEQRAGKGIGPLTVYDVALRIGVYRGLMPDRIYMHAGTRLGARRLGLSAADGMLEIARLPSELRVLSASEIEDFLCVFHDRLDAAEDTTGGCAGPGGDCEQRRTGATGNGTASRRRCGRRVSLRRAA